MRTDCKHYADQSVALTGQHDDGGCKEPYCTKGKFSLLNEPEACDGCLNFRDAAQAAKWATGGCCLHGSYTSHAPGA